MEDVKESGGL